MSVEKRGRGRRGVQDARGIQGVRGKGRGGGTIRLKLCLLPLDLVRLFGRRGGVVVSMSMCGADRPRAQYLVPWARLGTAREETQDAQLGKKLWAWLERQVRDV